MKSRLMSLFIIAGVINVSAQSLSEKIRSEDEIYIAPLTHMDYYAMKLGAGEATKGKYDNTNEYQVGDVVDDASDPNVTFEIVGKFSNDALAELNKSLLDKLKEYFGSDKVKEWPKDMKKNMNGNWDQKKIDCKYYIIIKRLSINDPVLLQLFDSSTPIVVGGSDMFTINLYEKVKAGKKGKAIVKISHKITKGVDGIPIGDDYRAAASKFVEIQNGKFPALAAATLDEFLAEAEKQ